MGDPAVDMMWFEECIVCGQEECSSTLRVAGKHVPQ